jgi:hypothetical protein
VRFLPRAKGGCTAVQQMSGLSGSQAEVPRALQAGSALSPETSDLPAQAAVLPPSHSC